ncbi:monovalent cation/H+ antiporter complex subunit F [Nocardiopsis alborubida]|uniref:Multiple resistance and pH regulation protein F n=1 Tax=Nocardiopsis alborubida TaxID=146802 RepID=A0A7X6MDY6_9ACTN|nr:monovalent cation/H+ antiporter complex subunit F [Nocardiopsis alborubida]NKY99002.1 multiple resistance and pH regulation protein F [Nocardiopsis alborubida]
MTVLWIVIGVMLGLAALLSVTRMLIGPGILDRAISVDVLLASALVGVGAYAAFTRDPTVLPTLLVLSLLGFVGSVSIAKFVARRAHEDQEHIATPTGAHPTSATPTDAVPESERREQEKGETS